MKKNYGYARVSTRDQNEMRQLIAMREFGVKDGNIFLDKKSGKDYLYEFTGVRNSPLTPVFLGC